MGFKKSPMLKTQQQTVKPTFINNTTKNIQQQQQQQQ